MATQEEKMMAFFNSIASLFSTLYQTTQAQILELSKNSKLSTFSDPEKDKEFNERLMKLIQNGIKPSNKPDVKMVDNACQVGGELEKTPLETIGKRGKDEEPILKVKENAVEKKIKNEDRVTETSFTNQKSKKCPKLRNK